MSVEHNSRDRSRTRLRLDGVARVAVWLTATLMGWGLMCHGHDWYMRAAGRPAGDELMTAGVASRDAAWTELAFRHGASVNARARGTGMTPLMWAARDGDVPLVRRLLAAGADVSATSDHGLTALVTAAGRGSVEVIHMLIAAGAAVDQPALRGGTALHVAAGQGRADSVAALLAHGADADARDREGLTPLIAAAHRQQGVEETARHLLAAGADPEAESAAGETPLSLAEAVGDPELLALLRSAASGAD